MNSIYPIESFEIPGKNGEPLSFYHGTVYKNETDIISYFLRDSAYQKAYQEQKKKHLLGEETPEENIKKSFEPKAFISINQEEKWVNFGVEWDYMRNGYGRAIYDNYSHILEMLGIPNPEQYELRIYGNSNHDFFKKIQTEKLIAKTTEKPDKEKASQLLAEFSKYPNTMEFSEFNNML